MLLLWSVQACCRFAVLPQNNRSSSSITNMHWSRVYAANNRKLTKGGEKRQMGSELDDYRQSFRFL